MPYLVKQSTFSKESFCKILKILNMGNQYRYDWNNFDERRAFGASVSLYEKNPLTGVNAGEPVADVWGVVGRNNNGVLALADGVNWGEGARLAARCAVRGAIDHMNEHIEMGKLTNTTEVFHELLASFHSAHSLILQEGGMLTTLCVAVVAPAVHCDSWVLCVCNVGDSLCFVYNRDYGVREVTMGSHDIDQMRDMRDAGGALGPVDGRNPQLHNLTCSMTFVEEGDIVFITSDGVSDNFDPVVGKFCVIKRAEVENKENAQLPPRDNRKLSVATKDSPSREFARPRTCAATLPCVDAASRHELMLVRMRDIIANGIDPPKEACRLSPRHEPLFPRVTASVLSHRLIQFATHLSQAKRRTLENPELYKKEKMTKSEQRARRRAVREKIADMPGKLDHASVVAYSVGRHDDLQKVGSPTPRAGDSQTMENGVDEHDDVELSYETKVVNVHMENFGRMDRASCCATLVMKNGDKATSSLNVRISDSPEDSSTANQTRSRKGRPVSDYPLKEIVDPRSPEGAERPISPYEQLPVVSSRETTPANGATGATNDRRKKHSRGSTARHTLGVDVQWLKRFVTRKDEHEHTQPAITPTNDERDAFTAVSGPERVSLRQRLRVLLGSNRNLHTHHMEPQVTADKPSRPQWLALRSNASRV
nr:PP2C-like domain-containing protein [Haemonchus contortus]